jgi:hypothetical protein
MVARLTISIPLVKVGFSEKKTLSGNLILFGPPSTTKVIFFISA